MDPYPKVSVVVAAYNVERYIEDALRSIESQTFSDFEVLVVNDGSTDGTPEVVDAVCQRDRRFRRLDKANGGLSSARNFGIRHAVGSYIALLDGDDAYEPTKLANHVDWLDKDPAIGVVYSASRAMRDDGTVTLVQLDGKPILANSLQALLCKNFVGHGSNAVFRRCIVDEIGDFDEALPSSEDLDFWVRIAGSTAWKFQLESQALCRYRVRPTGLSFNVGRMQQCTERVFDKALQAYPSQVQPILRTARAYLYRYLARVALTSAESSQARCFMRSAIASDATIFLKDPKSLLTLLAVVAAPLAQFIIGRLLNAKQQVKPLNSSG